MKTLLKYIFTIVIVCFCTAPIIAQKKHKSKAITTKSIAKKKQKGSTSKKNSVKKGKKGKTQHVEKFDEVANLNTLLKNASLNVNTSKADSIPEKVVTIMSAFKPQLKNVAKIDFVNASAQNDTTSLLLDYQVPSQNLSFQYKPISLIPRAYKIDSLQNFKNNGNVKIGLGNYFHHYIDLNFNAKDIYNNTHSFNINNEAIAGLHHLQTVRNVGFNYIGDIYLNEDNHLATQVFYNQSQRYRYGLVADTSNVPASNFKQNYYHTGIALGWLNFSTQHHLIQYHPTLKLEHFEGQAGSTNNWLYLKNPMYIQTKHDLRFDFDLSYSLNQYNPKGYNHQTNYELRFDPTVEFNKLNSIVKLGVSPTIENGRFNLYPTVEYKKKLTDTNYLLIAGWHTHVMNNQYTSLVQINPWIISPSKMEMTSQEQKFVEIQINAGKRLDYGFKFSLNDYKNLPLFNKLMGTNRANYGLFYQTLFETKASTIELEAHLRYQFSDKLLIENKLKYIQFNALQDNAKPWGVLPLELNSSLSWKPNDKWIIDGGVHYWTGATLLNESGKPYDLKNSFVLNAGFSYKMAPKWKAWVKGENLLDKPYERWADYPSLGVQLIAGIVYSFTK